MKQTAVEWLYKEIELGLSEKGIKTALEQAKEMEKQQIIDAYIKGCADNYSIDIVEDAEQYYNNTFNK